MLSTLRHRVLRPWTVLPLALVLGGGTWFVTRSDADDDTGSTSIERTVEVTVGPLNQVVSASGTIEAAATDQLSFSAAGTVTAVNVAAGDEVAAGDVLATMDSPELEAAVTQAEASVAEAEAKLDDDGDADASDTQIAADQSSLDSAQRQLDAAFEALAGAQLVATVDGTVAQVDLAVGDELGSGGASGTALTGSGTGSGQSSSTLGSGSGGGAPTGSSSGSTGTDATATSAQIEVVSTGAYRVELGIDATQIDLVAKGQEATISLSSSTSATGGFPGGGAFPGAGGGAATGTGDGTSQDSGSDAGTDGTGTGAAADDSLTAAEPDATGTVTSVGAIADASSGVASFPVEVSFESASDELFVGTAVDVEIAYEQVDDAVQVPAQAVTTTGGASTVVVDTGDGRETRTVETGITSGGMVQITSGLEAGDQVVITIATVRAPTGSDSQDGGEGGGGGQFTPPPGFDPANGGFGGGPQSGAGG